MVFIFCSCLEIQSWWRWSKDQSRRLSSRQTLRGWCNIPVYILSQRVANYKPICINRVGSSISDVGKQNDFIPSKRFFLDDISPLESQLQASSVFSEGFPKCFLTKIHSASGTSDPLLICMNHPYRTKYPSVTQNIVWVWSLVVWYTVIRYRVTRNIATTLLRTILPWMLFKSGMIM